MLKKVVTQPKGKSVISRPEPILLREEFGGFSVFFRKAPLGESGEKVGEKWGDHLSRNEAKILEAIVADPRITINVLSEKIGIGTTAVENNLKKLKS